MWAVQCGVQGAEQLSAGAGVVGGAGEGRQPAYRHARWRESQVKVCHCHRAVDASGDARKGTDGCVDSKCHVAFVFAPAAREDELSTRKNAESGRGEVTYQQSVGSVLQVLALEPVHGALLKASVSVTRCH